MERLICEIIDSGFLRYAIDAQLQEDAVYLKDKEDAEGINAYMKKLITKEQGLVLDDYEAVMRSASARAQEVAYVQGVRDTIACLKRTGALKVI